MSTVPRDYASRSFLDPKLAHRQPGFGAKSVLEAWHKAFRTELNLRQLSIETNAHWAL